MLWRIYYADHVVEGTTAEQWRAAPDDGVQVVVRFEPVDTPRWHWSGGPVRDRQLWTGADTYDPFGWGKKRGRLIEDAAYHEIWEKACGSRRP